MLDIINFQANEIYDEINNEGLTPESAIDRIRVKTDYFDQNDKLQIQKVLMEKYHKSYDDHLKECKADDPRECQTSRWNIPFLHILNKDIAQLEYDIAATIPENSDFSKEEQDNTKQRINEILEELQHLKTGQEIIWTDLMNEMNEMKEMFYLNKKSWRQLLTGKLIEMVGAGVISETVSKNIVESLNPITDKLLE